MRTKILAVLAIMFVGILGLTACGTESEASGENWRPINLTLDGSAEGVKCDQIDSAIRQVDRAITEKNEDALATLGLLDDNGFKDAASKDVKSRLVATKKACERVAVTATAADCPDGTPLTYDPNKDFSVKSDGVKNRTEDLEAIQADPRNLAYRAHDLKFWENPNNWEPLTTNEGKCLSAKGEVLYAKVEGALTASSTKVDENGKANPNWYNTGMGAQGPVVNRVAGIEGNLDAIIYTLADGTVIVVLERCANLALPAAPKHYAPVHIPGSRTPPPTGTGGPPPGTTTDNPPPTTRTTLEKPRTGAPESQGNANTGGGTNATPGRGTRNEYTPPPQEPYTPPAAPPKATATQPPRITQQPPVTSQVPVAPSTQPPNNGSVEPAPGGDFG